MYKVRFGPLNFETLLLFAIILLASVLRIYHIGFKSLWFDEAVIFWNGQGTFAEIMSNNATKNSAPILYTLIVRLLSEILWNDGFIRSFSAIVGVLAVPAMFAFSRQYFSKATSFVLALFVAIAPIQIVYSQELREYSFSFLLAILLMSLFERYLKERSNKTLLYLGAVATLALFTQYGLAILLFAFNVVIGIQLIYDRFKSLKLYVPWIFSQIMLIPVLLVVYETSLRHHLVPGGFGAASYLSYGYYNGNSLFELAYFGLLGLTNVIDFSLEGKYLLYIFLLIGLWYFRQQKLGRLFLVILIPLFLTFLLGVVHIYPFGTGRQSIFLVPSILLLFGAGVESLLKTRNKILYIGCIALLIVLGAIQAYQTAVHLNNRGTQDMQAVVARIQANKYDSIYVYFTSQPAFRFYRPVNSTLVHLPDWTCKQDLVRCESYMRTHIKSDSKILFVGLHACNTDCQLELQKLREVVYQGQVDSEGILRK